jgi:hypothetical protein
MSSVEKIESARRNGAKSVGPVTPEGKERSSRNATRHGLLSKTIVLSNEDQGAFDNLCRDYVRRFRPVGQIELDLVNEMAQSRWRKRRIPSLESSLLDNAMADMEEEILERHGDIKVGHRLGRAFSHLANNEKSLALLYRYEARLARDYEKALTNLRYLQGQRQEDYETNPTGPAPSPWTSPEWIEPAAQTTPAAGQAENVPGSPPVPTPLAEH